MEALWQTELEDLPPPRRGKVRDIYDLGEELLIVASDRLSAYDYVLQPAIPDVLLNPPSWTTRSVIPTGDTYSSSYTNAS